MSETQSHIMSQEQIDNWSVDKILQRMSELEASSKLADMRNAAWEKLQQSLKTKADDPPTTRRRRRRISRIQERKESC